MKAVLILALVVSVIAGPQPKFPNDWTANEELDLIVFQGDYKISGEDWCCNRASNCQVQTEYEKGVHYFDYSHNRTRFDDSVSGQVVVNDYKIQKSMLVVNQACKEYCPMQGERLEPGFLDKNATDLGKVVIKGQTLEKWQWKETIFGIIVMETDTVYVDQSTDPAVPVMEHDDLTPFGQHIGGVDQTWANFKPGTPDPSLFIVNNVDHCPMSQNCGNQKFQMRRLAERQVKTWAHYYQLNQEAALKNKLEL